MTVSIIIAVKTWAENLEDCVNKCLQQNFPDFEILILPDFEIATGKYTQDSRIRIIPTGNVSPPKKRDLAMHYGKGEIFAFIDDDAYPAKDWLKNAIKNFIDPEVAAVGGPAITPQDDNLRQKASGLVYGSVLVSGKYIYRYSPRKKQIVDDYPSCNLFVRKSIMEKLGGFNTDFWPGEDTKLCLEITKKFGKKIIYDPDVLVYHHRRMLFLPHLKQVANYALHRGYFAKKYPQTSLRFSYFIPSFFILSLAMGSLLSLVVPIFRPTYLTLIFVYFILVFFSSINKNPKMIALVTCGIVLTHLTYGLYFLKGLVSSRLKEDK